MVGSALDATPKLAETAVPEPVVPSASVYCTVLPTSALAARPCCSESTDSVALVISSICCTWVNCAVWDMNCELSTGWLGSWYFSWATSRLRKSFSSRFEPLDGAVPDALPVWIELVVVVLPCR